MRLDRHLFFISTLFIGSILPALCDFESNTLMVITGNSDDNARRGTLQIIRVSNSSQQSIGKRCLSRRQHPISGFFIMGTYLRNDNVVLTCGDIGDARSQFCHKYRPIDDSWSESVQMVTRRSQSATVWLESSTKWWVTGGMGTRLRNATSTEVYNARDRRFEIGTSLPEPVQDHCLVKLNHTHFFIAGGEMRPNHGTSSLLCNHAWIYDKTTNHFHSMSSMTLKRSAPSCGLVSNPSGSKFVVVAGGIAIVTGGQSQQYSKSVEMFNLQTQSWSQGPDLPLALAAAPTVPREKSFLLMGGYKEKKDQSDSFYSKKVYQFEFYRSWWSSIWWPNTYYQRWRERIETLTFASARFPAFWVPNEWC